MKMLQSLNALAGKISPGSPTDSNANKVHMHNNNNNNNNVHHHPYSKQQTQPSPSHSANGDQKENTPRKHGATNTRTEENRNSPDFIVSMLFDRKAFTRAAISNGTSCKCTSVNRVCGSCAS
ncbi:PREDICTED: skp1-protein-hydroxyproline N-acetylglucosaminyltransferase-like [Trachymyrmex cornetzi]|uniref:skp1-protein-hydroxyproline N-acetylglucosaminyltransferase-like n=1 Tax=Trachymyrmex cornetzi TaxID=471704 RepID=UPI00084F79AE|nr:PREDICTED: skp1-protein-hydroxyproline N-acetylglucosaminyltransferase-like [Trachymyrmex cornetzi]XP_018373234.1 PREDICTED: skp1-protein-hydroxyproline N-acetylglucosaminyltransferase-like [Trachymyrmex cornetzi]XP_018373235.1 PREDICTED: skp1-protein-hydroxyproline N-acetylglucosaminyltransferase-like [Trachymyrmex cornetzi]